MGRIRYGAGILRIYRSSVRGKFYYLYLVVDVWGRMIVGWSVHEEESAQLASVLIQEACLRYGVDPEKLVLHSDNGGTMKGATMLATLQWLGIVPSFSRLSVSNDNLTLQTGFRQLFSSKNRCMVFVFLFSSPRALSVRFVVMICL